MTTELIGDDHAPQEPADEEHLAVADFDTIGPYRVLQQLGEGGMGVVHLALDRRGKAVAVKVLRPHIAHDADARARLAREVETLGRVRSARVAPVFDSDLDGDQPYIVTRYVPGPSLDAHVREHGPLDADALQRLGVGLAEAIRGIHAAGVVHRDLKPGNVLLVDGDPVLIDFGIAHVAEASRMTMTGLVMGTPGYLSPEIVEGADVSEATDWWGWAATLAFAATGRPPFGRGGMEAVLARVCRGEADLAGVDPNLAPLLYAALSPDAARRPDADETLAALRTYAQGRPVTEALPVRARQLTPATQQLAVPATAHLAQPEQRPAPGGHPPPQSRPEGVAAAPAPWPAQGPHAAPAPPSAQALQPAPRPVQAVQPYHAQVHAVQPYVQQAPQPWSGATAPREGDPRIGRPKRTGVLAAGLAAVTALAAVAPLVAVGVALLWGTLARTVDRSMTSIVLRRHHQGRRRSDVAVAVAASPWRAVLAALSTLVASLLPLVVGASGVVAAAVLQALVDGNGVNPSTSLPLAAGALVGLLAAWWGPGGASLRRGSRSVARGVATSPGAEKVVVVALLVVVGAAVYGLTLGGIDISWWPLTRSPLPGPTPLP